MKNISDERLDQMLTEYCEADTEQSFVFDPNRKREKIVPFARMNRMALAAASFVLVSVLSLTVYFLFGNKNHTPIAVSPSPVSVSTPSTPTGESGGDPQPVTEPTEPRSFLQSIVDFLFPQPDNQNGNSIFISPTEKSVKPTEPVKGTKPTERAGEKPTEKTAPQPTVKPTQPDHVPPTIPVDPTWNPPQPTVPAEPPWNPPTQGGSDPYPWDPEPTDPPDEGDEPGCDIPTEGGGTMATPPYICAYIDASLLNGSTTIYCKVYNSSGRRLGSSDLYDWTHEAYVDYSAGDRYAEVVFEPIDGSITEPGYYNFVFYDGSGRLLTQIQEYVR